MTEFKLETCQQYADNKDKNRFKEYTDYELKKIFDAAFEISIESLNPVFDINNIIDLIED